MYAFRVSPHVENLIKECAARLITLGVPVSQSVFFFECGGSSRFGYCKKGDAKGASGFEYSIAINKYIVNDNSNLPRREKFRFFLVRYGTSAAYRYFK